MSTVPPFVRKSVLHWYCLSCVLQIWFMNTVVVFPGDVVVVRTSPNCPLRTPVSFPQKLARQVYEVLHPLPRVKENSPGMYQVPELLTLTYDKGLVMLWLCVHVAASF